MREQSVAGLLSPKRGMRRRLWEKLLGLAGENTTTRNPAIALTPIRYNVMNMYVQLAIVLILSQLTLLFYPVLPASIHHIITSMSHAWMNCVYVCAQHYRGKSSTQHSNIILILHGHPTCCLCVCTVCREFPSQIARIGRENHQIAWKNYTSDNYIYMGITL